MRRLERELEINPGDIELLIFDVDGVMTDNHILFLGDGKEAKFFSVADGFALKVARHGPIKFAVISARYSEPTVQRCTELGITDIFQQPDKLAALEVLLEKYDLTPQQVGMVGNDFPDTILLERVGLAVCTADCEAEVMPFAHYQTKKQGGQGCCREVIDYVLKAKGIELLTFYRQLMENAGTRKKDHSRRS